MNADATPGMRGAVTVVIAPDSFHGSLAADRVADALAAGLRPAAAGPATGTR